MMFKDAYGQEFDDLNSVKTILRNCVTGAFFRLAEQFIELNKEEYSTIRTILHELASEGADNKQGMLMSFYLELVKKYDREFENDT